LNLIASISAVLGIAVIGAISAHQVSNAWDSSAGAASSSVSTQQVESLRDEVISGAIPEIESKEGKKVAKVAGDAYLSGVTEALRIAALGVAIAGVVSLPLLGRRGRVRAGVQGGGSAQSRSVPGETNAKPPESGGNG
jgi:hypothetical protein